MKQRVVRARGVLHLRLDGAAVFNAKPAVRLRVIAVYQDPPMSAHQRNQLLLNLM